MTPPDTVTDDVVMHRAVIDHTATCERCNGPERGCPVGRRLKEMSAAANAASRA